MIKINIDKQKPYLIAKRGDKANIVGKKGKFYFQHFFYNTYLKGLH